MCKLSREAVVKDQKVHTFPFLSIFLLSSPIPLSFTVGEDEEKKEKSSGYAIHLTLPPLFLLFLCSVCGRVRMASKPLLQKVKIRSRSLSRLFTFCALPRRSWPCYGPELIYLLSLSLGSGPHGRVRARSATFPVPRSTSHRERNNVGTYSGPWWTGNVNLCGCHYVAAQIPSFFYFFFLCGRILHLWQKAPT
jgi:hypothetical protein